MTEQRIIRNIDVIIRNLEMLKENYEEADGDEEETSLYDEYGSDLTWQIDCHPVFKGDPPCINGLKGVEYNGNGWEGHCRECKKNWLFRRYES